MSTNIFVHDPLIRTVVYVDLVRYSDIVKSLQMGQKFGANAILLLNNQLQSLIRQAVDACEAKPDCFVKSTGDGAILQFDSPTVAEHFAVALHQLSFDQHCKSATSAYEWRSFRVGIFTGEVVLSTDEIAGAVVGFASRLEAAASAGGIVIDVGSWAQLPPKQQALYGPKEVLQLKSHDPAFEVHRRQVVASPRWDNATPNYLNRILNWAFESWRRQKRRWIAVGLILLFMAVVIGALAFKRKFESGAIAQARLHSAHGDALVNKNKFVEAEAEFRNAIKFDPKDSRYYFKLAEAMSQGNHSFPEVQTELVRGEAVARKSILSDPQNAAHHHALARLLSAQGRDAEAEAAFREAIRLNPTNPEYHHDFAAFGLYQRDKFYEAESEVREAIRLKPYFDYYDSLAQILEATENYVEAEVEIRRAIDLNPEPYWTYEHLGNILWAQEKCNQAFEAYKQALSRNPKSAFSENGLGNIFFAQGRHAEAELRYRRAIELDPTYPVYHSNLGDLLSILGRADETKSLYERAEAAHRELIKRFPNDPLLHKRFGEFLSQRERFEEAEAEYEAAVSLDPEQGTYHVILGNWLAGHNKPDEAKLEFKNAESIYRQQVKQHQKEPGYHFNLAIALYGLEQVSEFGSESRSEFEKAAALSGETPSYYLVLADFFYERKDFANSIFYYRTVVRLRPDNAEYRSFLGNALFAMGEYEEAEWQFRRAQELSPEEPHHLNSLGDCYLKLNQNSLAEQAYRKAITLNPKNARYYNGLAVALGNQTHYADALSENRKAIEIDPTAWLYWDNLASILSAYRKFEEARAARTKANQLKESSTSISSFECR